MSTLTLTLTLALSNPDPDPNPSPNQACSRLQGQWSAPSKSAALLQTRAVSLRSWVGSRASCSPELSPAVKALRCTHSSAASARSWARVRVRVGVRFRVRIRARVRVGVEVGVRVRVWVGLRLRLRVRVRVGLRVRVRVGRAPAALPADLPRATRGRAAPPTACAASSPRAFLRTVA